MEYAQKNPFVLKNLNTYGKNHKTVVASLVAFTVKKYL